MQKIHNPPETVQNRDTSETAKARSISEININFQFIKVIFKIRQATETNKEQIYETKFYITWTPTTLTTPNHCKIVNKQNLLNLTALDEPNKESIATTSYFSAAFTLKTTKRLFTSLRLTIDLDREYGLRLPK